MSTITLLAPTASQTKRVEHDLLGYLAVPADAYYGVQTARALDNFKITGIPLSHFPNFVRALAMVKKAAARANRKLGLLPQKLEAAISTACDEVIAGQWHDHFAVDMIQGGAGTSTNMNANEVIANRAIEIMGGKIGSKKPVHPNDDVNKAQSLSLIHI